MLEPMKKRPIKIAFTGPVGNRERAIDALKKLGFVESTDSVPWREAFPDLTDDQLPGNSLKGARVKEGIAQKQLAELTGIKQHHISEMENHKRSIGKKNAMEFAKALDISYKVFL
jgi:ribosome-binding protein aMBF1 (putative translation factor)